MAEVLYIASLNPRDGKTVLGAALARRWQQAGRGVEFLKPVTVNDSADQTGISDEEFLFARQVLGLKELRDSEASISISAESADDALKKDKAKVKSICKQASKGVDILLLEAPGGSGAGRPERKISPAVAEAVQARVLLVVRYHRELDKDEVTSAAELFGEAVLGVVINGVPQLSWRMASTSLAPSLKEAGHRVLGLIPQTRAMFGIGVHDLVERLKGRYALKFDGSEKLVENIMIGANLLDAPGYPAGPEYFGRKDNKVVIAKGDRPDFQWAAMDTPTQCIILTGNHEPIPYVLEKAKEKKIPLAVVEQDTLDTLAALEEMLVAPRLNDPLKLEKFQALVEENLDLSSLDELLKA